jgi:hypothetical protein
MALGRTTLGCFRLAVARLMARADSQPIDSVDYNLGMADDVLFEVLTLLHFRVRVTRAYWDLIITIKHPVMAGREDDVQETLQNPSEIRQSKSDQDVFLFYKPERIGQWVCAVSKRLNGDGFLITAYLTDAIKEGELVWPK